MEKFMVLPVDYTDDANFSKMKILLVLVLVLDLSIAITRRRTRTIKSHWPLFNFMFTRASHPVSSAQEFYEHRSHSQTTADLRGGD
jgi:hypothetical protein